MGKVPFHGCRDHRKDAGRHPAAAISVRWQPRGNRPEDARDCFDPFLSAERAEELGVEKVELEELFTRSDFITLHVPLTDKTRNIINAEASRG